MDLDNHLNELKSKNDRLLVTERENEFRLYGLLIEAIGSFIGQMTDMPIKAVEFRYHNLPHYISLHQLTDFGLLGLIKPQVADPDINRVREMVGNRGIQVAEKKLEAFQNYSNFVEMNCYLGNETSVSAGGSLYSDNSIRITNIRGVNVEYKPAQSMIYIRVKNPKKILVEIVNIIQENRITSYTEANSENEENIIIVSVDGYIQYDDIEKIVELDDVLQARPLVFGEEIDL